MKKVLLLSLEGCELLETAPFVDVFGWNNALRRQKIHVKSCGFTKEVKCSWNLKIVPELILNNHYYYSQLALEYDALIIPGGFGLAGYFRNILNPNLKLLIEEFRERNRIIVGICTGALILGELGFLKGVKATTYLSANQRYFNQLKNLKAIPVFQEIVDDKNIITSSGPASAPKVAIMLLGKLTSTETANLVKKEMGFEF